MGHSYAELEVLQSDPTVAIASYDSTKWNLGNLMWKNSSGVALGNWVGPRPVLVGRPLEASTTIALAFPHVIKHSENIFYVFFIENATASATRRVVMYEYNRANHSLNWIGYITLTFPTATNHTSRGFGMDRLYYTTGTASASGTAVTGSGSTWTSTTSGISVGARIGFGSTDPSQIATWYNISAIGGATAITLSTSAGTVADGPYVIEEYRAVVVTTNATTTNGGLYVAKGLHPGIFIGAGTSIPAATTADSIRAVYWLADAATVTHITGCGLALDDATDNFTRHAYCVDSTGAKIFKYNTRVALAGLASGKSVSGFLLVTGVQALNGTAGTNNNGCIGILNHGPGSGVKCLYFVTTTRVYRVPLTNIVSASTTWQADQMTEVPAGGNGSFSITNGLSAVEIMDSIDMLFVSVNTNVGGYITKYNATALPFDYNVIANTNYTHTTIAASGAPIHPTVTGGALTVWSEEGMTFLCKIGTTSAINQIYVVPFGAHWDFSNTQGEIISPKLATPNCYRYHSVSVRAKRTIGDDVHGMPPEPFRTYYRTSGIDDNSGGWTLLDELGDISAIAGATHIQFRFKFRLIGRTCIPSQILGIAVAYEDNTTVASFRPSSQFSDATTRTFAWRHAVAFGSAVPALRIRVNNAVTGASIIDDTTLASAQGVWQKSVDDGASWTAYNTTDKANEITYIRYVASSLPAGEKVSALLTVN